jgi:hypothetical protein
VFARAEQERGYAVAAHAAGDDVAANLHAERAIAAYGHALAVARLAAATTELSDAQKALDDTTAQEETLAASNAKLQAEADELEQRARIARERLVPATSGSASAERQAARWTAARALAVEARLLCGAARLVQADATGLTPADDAVAQLGARLDKGGRNAVGAASAVDDAGAARARCLDVLTRARRAGGHDDGRADALLAELSASGGWDPTRDERGVVVTLRGAFKGEAPTSDGAEKLAALGRVAASHPGFAVQIVVHDAQSPADKDEGDARRGDAVVQAIVAAGAPAARVKAELAGTRAPVADPDDPKVRARNERLDVVFVAGN